MIVKSFELNINDCNEESKSFPGSQFNNGFKKILLNLPTKCSHTFFCRSSSCSYIYFFKSNKQSKIN